MEMGRRGDGETGRRLGDGAFGAMGNERDGLTAGGLARARPPARPLARHPHAPPDASCPGNNTAVSDRLVAAGAKTFERVWPMPLAPEHSDGLKCTRADLRSSNTGALRRATATGLAAPCERSNRYRHPHAVTAMSPPPPP